MIMIKPETVINRFAELQSERGRYDGFWQDIRDLIRPDTSEGYSFGTPAAARGTEKIYDSTAPQAAGECAAALQSYLCNPADRWFGLGVQGFEDIQHEPESAAWLDQVSDRIFTEFANEDTKFNNSTSETFLDLVVFGTAILSQEWNLKDSRLIFRSIPVADCYLDEDSEGRVDTVFRLLTMTTRQIMQQFSNDIIPKCVAESKKSMERWEVIHAVFPRTDRDVLKMDTGNKPWASVWVCRKPQTVMKESGYNSFPYAVPRWVKPPGEIYGSGPGKMVLPDVKLLNRMEYTILKASQKQVDPPLTVPNDGFLLPIKTSPGSLNFKEPGAEQLEPLIIKGDLPFGEEKSEQKRNSIRRAFYAEWVQIIQHLKKERQSVFEIQKILESQLRMMAPMLGRAQSELLSPILARAYELLHEHNAFPPAPMRLQKRVLKPIYISPAARAQQGQKADSMAAFVQEMAPLAQINPTVLDAINLDKMAQEIAIVRGIPRSVLRNPVEAEAFRKQRETQAQMQQMAQTLEPVSKAVKNIAEAQAGAGQLMQEPII